MGRWKIHRLSHCEALNDVGWVRKILLQQKKSFQQSFLCFTHVVVCNLLSFFSYKKNSTKRGIFTTTTTFMGVDNCSPLQIHNFSTFFYSRIHFHEIFHLIRTHTTTAMRCWWKKCKAF